MTNESNTKQKCIFRGTVLAAVVLLLAAVCCVGAVSAITGSGTATDPYKISNADDLKQMADWINADNNTKSYYLLTGNINVSEISEFTGIGNVSLNKAFEGNFNGGGKTISGVITQPTYGDEKYAIGLFSYVKDASIYNLVLKDLEVKSDSRGVAGLVGRIDSTRLNPEEDMLTVNPAADGDLIQNTEKEAKPHYATQIHDIKLENVYCHDINNPSPQGNVALLIGRVNSGSVWIEGVTIDSASKVSSKGNRVGGMIGHVHQEGGTSSVAIVNCEMNAASINGNSNRLGGLIGSIIGGNVYLHKVNVASTSIVTNSGGFVGGLIGEITTHPSVAALDCHVKVDTISSISGSHVGGLLGCANPCHVQFQDCSVAPNTNPTLKISGDSNVGGLVGYHNIADKVFNIIECSVVDCSVAANSGNAAGLVGAINSNSQPIYSGNMIENVAVSVSDCQKGGLIDTGTYGLLPISSTSGIAPLKEIILGDKIITVKNSYVVKTGDSIKTSIGAGDYSGIKEKVTPITVTVGKEVTLIEDAAFEGFTALTKIDELDSITSIGANAFTGTGITSILPLASEGYEGYWVLDDGAQSIVSELTPTNFIYAAERKEKQVVTLNANGGTVSGNLIVNKSETPANAPLAEKTGYDFSGWYGEQELTNMVFNNTGVINTSILGWTDADRKWIHEGASTLYAKWTPHTYNITFNNNTGVGTMGNQTFIYDKEQALSTNTFTKTGYTFAGWAESSSGSVKYQNEEAVKNLTTEDNGTVDLYAIWTPNTYSITYKDAGDKSFSGTHESGYPTTHTYDTETTLKNASKAGYMFNGWYNDSAVTGTNVTRLGKTEYTEDITLYANWIAKEYNKTVSGGVADFTNDDISLNKVDVGSNTHITSVTFKFMGAPATITTKPTGFKSITPIKDAFNLTIEGEQTGDVTVSFTAGNSGHYFLAHYKNNAWEFLKAVATEVAGQYKAVVTKESGFSPFQIVSAEPEDAPRSSSSSRDYGSSIWLPATVEPTPTPAAEQPTQAVPTVSPIQTQQPASTPAPFVGLLAGLGAAAVFFGLRRR